MKKVIQEASGSKWGNTVRIGRMESGLLAVETSKGHCMVRRRLYSRRAEAWKDFHRLAATWCMGKGKG